MAPLPAAFLADLSALVKGGDLVTDAGAMEPHLRESRGLLRGDAGAVVFPRETAEVAALMRLAHAHGVRVVAQGGNTGLVGGGVPYSGLVISLAKMNRIGPVDALNATITVEAGAILQNVQAAAAEAGFLYPLSLASEGSCTIGGNIASNAGGTAVLRYGNTRDLVLGLEAVLPDGTVFNALGGLRKDNAGYDLKHLFIGSEGTLGIVTAAVLKLHPAPRSKLTAFVGAPSVEAVTALFGRLRAQAGERLTTFEILPRLALQMVLDHGQNTRDPLAGQHGWYALVELTAPEAGAPLDEALMPVLEAAMEAGEVEDAAIAASAGQGADFWRLRELISEVQGFEGASIKHDVSVPISRVADFMVEATALCEAAMPGVRVCAFGHIGDGNIHFNLTQPKGMERAAFLGQWHRFNTIVHDAVAARGGSIAAEHGVGLFKRDELPHYKDAGALALMAIVKKALDPKNLLNPGKVIRIGENLPEFRPGG